MLKNGVYFSTKELRQLGTKKHDLLAEYDKNQRDIVESAMEMAATYVPVLEKTSLIIAELDVLSSLSHVAAYAPHGYCKPEMTDSEEDGLGIEVNYISFSLNVLTHSPSLTFYFCSKCALGITVTRSASHVRRITREC